MADPEITTARVTPETVKHVATLARLSLTDDEVVQYTQDLQKILAMIAEIDQLDLSEIDDDAGCISGVDPVLAEDKASCKMEHQAVVDNAPSWEDPFFRVPQILKTSGS
ncbi:MAG: Asp-tRNA(Asn)/Glu-tRNA(Gln) amidotransferase subunit GatC [Cyanobacteria bacterium P01_H01_bin.74]